MKVFRRLLIKFILLVLVIGLFGGAAYLYHFYPQSSPASALEGYLSLLLENDTESAYEELDQSENEKMTQTAYETALQTLGYVLYDSFQIGEGSEREGTDGEAYVDYTVEFLDSSGTVQMESSFTVKKQEEAVLGLLPQWKVLSDHCMVENLKVTVPGGSTVYIDGEEADGSWLDADESTTSKDCYVIPSLLAGSVSVVIRNPVLESLEVTLATADGDIDYSDQMMTLRESARSACEELAVEALEKLYTAAVTEDTDSLGTVFEECLDDAISIAESQHEAFNQENTVTHATFQSVGIYDYEADFGEPVLTEDENGAVTVSLSFSYHYIVRNRERVETGEIWADGTNAWEMRVVPYTGEAVAEFSLSWYEDEWHIVSAEFPVISTSGEED